MHVIDCPTISDALLRRVYGERLAGFLCTPICLTTSVDPFRCPLNREIPLWSAGLTGVEPFAVANRHSVLRHRRSGTSAGDAFS